MTNNKSFSWTVFFDFFIPIFFLIIVTIIFRNTDLDLKIAGNFYNSTSKAFDTSAYPWFLFYKVGEFPAVICTIIAGIIFVAGFFIKSLKKYRYRNLFVVLLLIIGPGLVINVIFKDNWGRPRPRECVSFNGKSPFKKVGTPYFDNTNGGKSFPSGHASMGFFMIFPFFLYRACRRKKKAIMWLILGIAYGCLMSYARIFQGGHFTSDCLWAGGIDYLTAAVLFYVLKLTKEAETSA